MGLGTSKLKQTMATSTPLTGQTIINKFHLYCGDQSDLSSSDELYLANKVYDDIMNDRPWEFLKSSASGTITLVGDGTATIAPPTNFRYFAMNNDWTDNSIESQNNASPRVVFIGPNFTPYQVVNFSDRRQYRTSSGFCYYDAVQGKIIFPVAPTETAYEFDYIKNWDSLTLNTSPVFPPDFHDMIYQGMCIDSVIINLFDRSHSYAKENTDAYIDMLKKLRLYNSQFINN
jgi:hypothetical protein